MNVSEDPVLFESPEGVVRCGETTTTGTRRITVTPYDDTLFVSRAECTTSYSPELLEMILGVKGLGWLCDEVTREESPGYLRNILTWTVRAHLDPDEMRGRRVLDFGCGSGASTMILARLFADSEIVGVDIDAPALEIAKGRGHHYGTGNVSFWRATSPVELPQALGQFDVIMFSAVLEHLLPSERSELIPRIWRTLRPGGVLLVGETPHRYAPVETHTTGGLPLINYLPPPVVLRAARRLSRRIDPKATWPQLLRAGIRGGSERQLLRILERAGEDDARLRRPDGRLGLADEFDLWYQISKANELPGVKAQLRNVFRALKRISGISFTPYLSFAVERVGPPSPILRP